MTRKIAVARSSSRSNLAAGALSRQAMPVLFENSETNHSSADVSPISRAEGRNAVATLRTTWMISSIRPISIWIRSTNNDWPSPNCRRSSERPIRSAVSCWPSSSWISRAMRLRSSSRMASRWVDSWRSCAWDSLRRCSAACMALTSRPTERMLTNAPCWSRSGTRRTW